MVSGSALTVKFEVTINYELSQLDIVIFYFIKFHRMFYLQYIMCRCHNFANGHSNVFFVVQVHRVIPSGLADRDGRIQRGDRLISVNGRVLKDVSHTQALGLLKTKRRDVVLVVARPLELEETGKKERSLSKAHEEDYGKIT